MRKLTGTIIIIVLSILLVSMVVNNCKKKSTTGPGPNPVPNLVRMLDNSFSPDSIVVTLDTSVGVTVTWRNDGANIHTVTSNNNLFDTGDVLSGQSRAVTFNSKGTFPYHCAYHGAPDSGMAGTVIVQ